MLEQLELTGTHTSFILIIIVNQTALVRFSFHCHCYIGIDVILGSGASPLCLEQWAFCEDDISGNGGSVSSTSWRHGEELEVALEQKRATIDRKRESDARRNGPHFVLEMPPGNRAQRIQGSPSWDQEEEELGQNRNGSSSTPVFPTTTFHMCLIITKTNVNVHQSVLAFGFGFGFIVHYRSNRRYN